jgi:hypothetical protein
MTRRSVLGLVAVVLVTAACGPGAVQRALEQPTCTLRNNSVPLMAQAVPSARFLPCIAALPVGWSFQSSEIERGSARFWLDSDRAGPRTLEVTLTTSCHHAGTEIPSDEPGERLFVHLDSVQPRYRGTRYYLLPGGCVTYRFDFPAEGSTLFSTDASTAIGVLPRSKLERIAKKYGYRL